MKFSTLGRSTSICILTLCFTSLRKEKRTSSFSFQEHATKAGKAGAIRAVAAERGWSMDLGPVDETIEAASAGVGEMWSPGTMMVYVAQLHTEKAKAYEAIGRLRKYGA